MKIKLSIVVPVFRSQDILTKLVAEVKRVTDAQGLSSQFELILINDASPDGSWQVIADLAIHNDFIRGVSLRKNFGQHSAIMAGLKYAKGSIVVIMDDDLQHPPEEIANLIRTIDEGAEGSTRFGKYWVVDLTIGWLRCYSTSRMTCTYRHSRQCGTKWFKK